MKAKTMDGSRKAARDNRSELFSTNPEIRKLRECRRAILRDLKRKCYRQITVDLSPEATRALRQKAKETGQTEDAIVERSINHLFRRLSGRTVRVAIHLHGRKA